jgi:hypothetical protein
MVVSMEEEIAFPSIAVYLSLKLKKSVQKI